MPHWPALGRGVAERGSVLSGPGSFSASGKARGEAEAGPAGSPSTKGVYTVPPPAPNLDIPSASWTQSQDPTLTLDSN
ncbi:unnamed protein product [Rangifer tarandus platyrhynchus]|uniref:Uncharacterized protein n=2 Tax=Rangifer tarandus platyrhynchus TaxID=3082113 RepID=A0ACB0F0P6_RANTA|nr:unnamed protein product [Rangifer tarandus platyrhynchus]CAI9706083.1 unnamed protein product [Rangifer tarandus platyrhynchus]